MLHHILLPIFGYLLMAGIAINLHEFGHFLVARNFGIIAERFSFGFGKTLWSHTDKNGTTWTIARYPFGGYVRFADPAQVGPKSNSLSTLSPWKRLLIAFAGPASNFLLAAAIFSAAAIIWGYPGGRPIITRIDPNSPAEISGLHIDDRILEFNHHALATSSDVASYSTASAPGPILITFERHGHIQQLTANIVSRTGHLGNGETAQLGYLGIDIDIRMEHPTNPLIALGQGIHQAREMTITQLMGISQIATGNRSLTDLSGPIHIAKSAGATLSTGVRESFYFFALLSISLGIINLVPLPILDGGHILLCVIEILRGKPLSATFMRYATSAGFGILVVFFTLTLTVDILKLA